MKTSFVRPCLLGAALFVGLGSVAPVVQAAPKNIERATRLEIWPGQRTLIVLPLTVSETFLAGEGTDTSGSSALATALVPVISPALAPKLEATGKFSITRPYKNDPLVRRALIEQRINDDDVNAFVDSPGLTNAQNVLSQLGLEQPGMVAQVVVQHLVVGGTPDMPTVQLTMRGDLYEASSAQPFRTITVTSKPFGGKTPEDRLRAAADEAFGDIAAAFVEPPTEFQLPVPTAPVAPATTPAAGTAVTGPTPPATPAAPTTIAPVTPGGAKPPVAPQLPATAPPTN